MPDRITEDQMEHGRLLIIAGRNWLTLTDEDVDRGARAVVRDCCYRAEIGRCAIRYAEDIRNPNLKTALREAWDALNTTPCACGRTRPR